MSLQSEYIEELQEENGKLIRAIKEHRAQKADDRCIEDDDKLYEALGDGIKCDRRVGDKVDMLANCSRFIDRRWPTYVSLEKIVDELVAIYDTMQTRKKGSWTLDMKIRIIKLMVASKALKDQSTNG